MGQIIYLSFVKKDRSKINQTNVSENLTVAREELSELKSSLKIHCVIMYSSIVVEGVLIFIIVLYLFI